MDYSIQHKEAGKRYKEENTLLYFRKNTQLMKSSYVILLCLLCTTTLFAQSKYAQQNDSETQKGSVALEVGINNSYHYGNEPIYLYADVTATNDVPKLERQPLNIALIIDKSGSMRHEGKLENVKKAANFIIDNLTKDDYLSIVVYHDNMSVLRKAAKVHHAEAIKQKIESISPNGSTNLSGGMLEGYEQVKSVFGENYVNRVLLLSDGLANEGITDIETLKKIVSEKNTKDNISISTFGVGLDYNEGLMTPLAELGNGNYYFIEKADAIADIFKQELEGLFSVVAQNVRFVMEFPDDKLKVAKVVGVTYIAEGNQIIIKYNDLFADARRHILVKFEPIADFDKIEINNTLTYHDVLKDYDRKEVILKTIEKTKNRKLYDQNNDITTAFRVAFHDANDVLENASKAVDNRDYEKAKKILNENNNFLEDLFGENKPPEYLQKQYETNKKYFEQIDELKNASEQDRKMMQKRDKSSNYKQRYF